MITEDFFKEAAAELSELQLQDLDQSQEHAFSGKFQRKMRRLVNKIDHPVRYWFTNAAAVFLAVLVTAASLLFFSPSARATVVKWILNYSDDYVSCYHNGGAEAQKLDYILGEIPEGYEPYDVSESEGSVEYMYKDANGDLMYFICVTGSQKAQLHFSGTDMEHLQVNIGDKIADLFLSGGEDSSTIIWQDQDNQILFAIYYNGSQEDLIRMAKSVTKK